MAENAVTATLATAETSVVGLRPIMSDILPRMREPVMVPAMKMLMVSGASQARSHTRRHSDTTVDSEDAPGNVSVLHLDDSPGETCHSLPYQ